MTDIKAIRARDVMVDIDDSVIAIFHPDDSGSQAVEDRRALLNAYDDVFEQATQLARRLEERVVELNTQHAENDRLRAEVELLKGECDSARCSLLEEMRENEKLRTAIAQERKP